MGVDRPGGSLTNLPYTMVVNCNTVLFAYGCGVRDTCACVYAAQQGVLRQWCCSDLSDVHVMQYLIFPQHNQNLCRLSELGCSFWLLGCSWCHPAPRVCFHGLSVLGFEPGTLCSSSAAPPPPPRPRLKAPS